MAAKNGSGFLKTLLLTFLTRPTVHLYEGGGGTVAGPATVLVWVEQRVVFQVFHQLSEDTSLYYLTEAHKLIHWAVGRR